jgi:hypothetical protein
VADSFTTELNDGSDGGTNDTPLVVEGTVYSRGTINLYRDFPDASLNNTNPAVQFVYRPDFLFSIPGNIANELSNWRETSN